MVTSCLRTSKTAHSKHTTGAWKFLLSLLKYTDHSLILTQHFKFSKEVLSFRLEAGAEKDHQVFPLFFL